MKDIIPTDEAFNMADEKGGMAEVTIKDVYQGNGVIHVIDHAVNT